MAKSLKVSIELLAEIDDAIHFVGGAVMWLHQQQLGDFVQLTHLEGARFTQRVDALSIGLLQIGGSCFL